MANVLIVDDETAVREVLYDWLSRRNHTPLTANSGAQALEMLKAQRPAAILLDITMPGMSGPEAAKKIRLVDDAVPIVLLHGGGDPDISAAELKRLGIAGVIRKELGVELFLKSLDLVLRRLEEAPGPAEAPAAVRVPGPLLVVDDEPGILRLLSSFFESRGMRVITVASGEEALSALAKKPLAVLLDMTMPGMDGLMTLKKIKTAHPATPVIMVSGVGDESTVQEALDSGAYDYVTKPFNLEYLETVVLTKILLGIEG
ncbi:MAG: response regulator [Candidatus Omnitrophica bacterium]|nr:response regulator [Candidatus Omnitrophota bacterium]